MTQHVTRRHPFHAGALCFRQGQVLDQGTIQIEDPGVDQAQDGICEDWFAQRGGLEDGLIGHRL